MKNLGINMLFRLTTFPSVCCIDMLRSIDIGIRSGNPEAQIKLSNDTFYVLIF